MIPLASLPLALSPALSSTRALLAGAQESPEAAGALAGEALRSSWRLLEVPPAWVLVLVVLPLAALVAYGAYWREGLGRRLRGVLGTLRLLSILLLLLVLFRPVRVESQERVTTPEVIVLADDSASMSRRDAYRGDDAVRAALERLGDGPVEERTRGELVARGLERTLLPALAGEGYDARLSRFSSALEPLSQPGDLVSRGASTHLGDALVQALASTRGHHVTDLVVLSDGRSNGGLPLPEAAEAALAAGVPVHTVVVGDTRPERNLTLELVEVPSSVLEGDEVTLTVRVKGRGAEDVGPVEVVLEELDAGGNARVSATERVVPSETGERVNLGGGRGDAARGVTERRFRVSLPPLPDERMLDDNTLLATVRVTPERIRVLYVDGYPRWEYRQFKDLLLRADERIEASIFLLSATPDFPQEVTRGLPRLERVPTSREELLESYDVVVLGDVNPYAVSPDPARGEEFVESLREFVEKGGGLCVVAGEYDMPKAVAGTDFAKLLPVVLDPTGALAFEGDTTRELRPLLEDPVNPHEIVRLHPDVEQNRVLWEEEGGLRGFFWHYPVRGAKPGAQVLLRHPESSLSGADERDPLLVVGYYPAGRTMFLALDSTHRWQFRYEHRYHERFWRNAIRWLALGRLKGGDRRFQLESMRSEYSLDERVTLEARVLDEDFRPLVAERKSARLESPEGEVREVVLEGQEGRPGIFRATFAAERPGTWRAWMENAGSRVASADFDVVLPSRENADPSPDPQALLALSQRTGGRAVSLANLDQLLQEFPGGEERREPLASQLEDAWDHWGTLLLALGLLSLEWILRKRYELI